MVASRTSTDAQGTPARSLADDLRGRDDEALARLLLGRPDLARPTPGDLTTLASRAGSRPSIERAVDALDAAHLHALEAVLLLESPDVDAVAGLLGEDAETARVDELLTRLWELGLVWRGANGLVPVRTVGEILGPEVAGLGPRWADLVATERALDASEVAGRLAEAPEAARAVIERLAQGPSTGIVPHSGAAVAAVGWLVDQQLVVAAGDRIVLPREVALVVRGGRLSPTDGLNAPEVRSREVDRRSSEQAGAGSVLEVLGQLAELEGLLVRMAPRVLRGGGLAVRDLASLAESLDTAQERIAFVLELASAEGLVAAEDAHDPVWAPSTRWDTWAALSPARRWEALVLAWHASTRAPHRVGSKAPGTTRTINALGPDAVWPGLRSLRRELLRLLADLPNGVAPEADSLVEVMTWHRPRRHRATVREAVEVTLREMEWLGLTGRGALTHAGRLLCGSLPAGSTGVLAGAVEEHLPPLVDQVLLQADLTAVAPGPLTDEVAGFLRTSAAIESRGGATVYRFSESSLKHAMDAGLTSDELLATLGRISRTPVPQPLEYLIADLARAHGRNRVGAASSYLRTEEPAALDLALADRTLVLSAGLRRIAPTVAVAAVSPGALIDLLVAHDVSALAEDDHGVVRLRGTGRRRAPAEPRIDPPRVQSVTHEHAAEVVRLLREAEQRSPARESTPEPADPVVSLEVIRAAAAEQATVILDVTDRAGRTRTLRLYPRIVDAGRVRGTNAVSGEDETLLVHRIVRAERD